MHAQGGECSGSGDRWMSAGVGIPSCPVCLRSYRQLGLSDPPRIIRTGPRRGRLADRIPAHDKEAADDPSDQPGVQQAEIDAENGWMRAAEAGDPETWAEEDLGRLIEICGYGPPS